MCLIIMFSYHIADCKINRDTTEKLYIVRKYGSVIRTVVSDSGDLGSGFCSLPGWC